MSVLSLIQDHCRLYALNIPQTVVNSTDTGVQQLYGILLELLGEVVTESKFNITTLETVFLAKPGEDQGPMEILAPTGYQWMIPETFFDRTLRRPLYGPLTETEWQRIKALPNPGPFYKFRIMGGHLLLNPAPTEPFSVLAFEYVSSWAVKDSFGINKATITTDNDNFLFPENILKKGLAYKWKQIKGLPYADDEAKYYDLLNNYIARNKAPSRLNVSQTRPPGVMPGIFVPSGNWPV